MQRIPVNPKHAVAYIRVSTEEQALGAEAQVAACKAWARQHRTTIVATCIDQGASGADSIKDRAALIEALAQVKIQQAGILLVAKRDRLARDVYIAGSIERAVAATGARVLTADGTANGDTPADQFMRAILDAVAAFERDMIRARTKAALAAKKAKGELIGRVPYGWRVGEDGKTLMQEPREQVIVALVLKVRQAGLSTYKIVEYLREVGAVSRVGKPLRRTQVQRILARAA